MTENDQIYNCDDKDLGAMLQRLFDEGHDEVVVTHPIDGKVVVTKADFKKHLANIEKARNMSPADRLLATKRAERIRSQRQIRFRTAMLSAPLHTVDIEDDDGFGKDIDGNLLDIDGMVFLPVAQYLKGIKVRDNELGCFVDEHNEKRKPIRIART